MAKSFECTLVTPERSVLDAQATYVDLPAHDGQLGVMVGRAPMLIELGVGKATIQTDDGQPRRYVLDGGFAQMNDDRLTLLCERAIAGEEVTAEQAREAMNAAQNLPKSTVQEVEQRDHDLAVARHMQTIAGG